MTHSFYSPKEAAKHLNVTEKFLAGLRGHGRGPQYEKLGNGPKAPVVYRLTALRKWREAQKRAAHAAAKAKVRAEQDRVRANAAERAFRQKILDVLMDAGFDLDDLRRVMVEEGYSALKEIPVDNHETFVSALIDAALEFGAEPSATSQN